MNRTFAVHVARLHVLVVEDDADIRETITALLELDGHQVEAASNGREALARLSNGLRPDLILLDLMMPIMDGWEFRKRQTLDGGLAEIPVVVMSGDARITQKASSLGVTHSLSKPFTTDALMSTVTSAVTAGDACGARGVVCQDQRTEAP